jgi:hypothetical protein
VVARAAAVGRGVVRVGRLLAGDTGGAADRGTDQGEDDQANCAKRILRSPMIATTSASTTATTATTGARPAPPSQTCVTTAVSPQTSAYSRRRSRTRGSGVGRGPLSTSPQLLTYSATTLLPGLVLLRSRRRWLHGRMATEIVRRHA